MEEEEPEEGQVRSARLPHWLLDMLRKQDPEELLSELRGLFPRTGDRRLPDSLPEVSDLDEETQDRLINNDDECRLFSEFVERTRDFIKCRRNTLDGPDERPEDKRRSRYYLYFRKYLRDNGFMESMVDVIYRMFLLHPSLPEDPIKYLRENYGGGLEEERSLVREWLGLTRELEVLARENAELRERLRAAREAHCQDAARLPSRRSGASKPSLRWTGKTSVASRRSVQAGRAPSVAGEERADTGQLEWRALGWRRARAASPGSETSPASDYSLASLGSLP